MSRPRADPVSLTTEQWKHVQDALPEARTLARALARRCRSLDIDELETLCQDGLMLSVLDYDASRGATLMQFARNVLCRDLLRAGSRRAKDPVVAAGLLAADFHADAMSSPDLAVQFAESDEEKDARALSLGEELVTAALYAYEGARLSRTSEDDLIARARWEELKRVADGAAQDGAMLLDLLYVEDMTWKAIANKLGISEATAKRLEEAAIARLRKFLARERG